MMQRLTVCNDIQMQKIRKCRQSYSVVALRLLTNKGNYYDI